MDVTQLKAAQDTLVATLRWAEPELWESPTPCSGWNVHALVDHLITGNERFVTRLGGGTPGDPPDRSQASPDDLVDTYEHTNGEVLEAFERPGVMLSVTQWPIGPLSGTDALALKFAETFAHGWDLAQAFGTTIDFDPDVVDEAYAWSGPALERIPKGRNPFGTPQPAPEDASKLDRLAALLGRQPAQS